MTDYAVPFLIALNGKVTPQMRAAVSAWQTQESGSRVIGNNPWNLHIGPPCPASAGEGVRGFRPSQPLRSTTIAGLIGNRYAGPGDRNVAIFDTPDHGSAAAARNLLRSDGRVYGYDKVVQQARIGDPIGFLNALAASSWSAGRYGTRNGGPNGLLAIYRRLAPAPTPAPKPAPKPEVLMSNPQAAAAITNAGYIDKIAQSAGIGARITPYTAKIVAQVRTLDAAVAAPTSAAAGDPVPAVVPDPDWFINVDNVDEVYLVGGSPSNPNGVSFTYAQAKQWFIYVLANGIGYHGVRATLLPGSAVLSPTGRDAVSAFEAGPNLIEAPEDFNPLGLPVIP